MSKIYSCFLTGLVLLSSLNTVAQSKEQEIISSFEHLLEDRIANKDQVLLSFDGLSASTFADIESVQENYWNSDLIDRQLQRDLLSPRAGICSSFDLKWVITNQSFENAPTKKNTYINVGHDRIFATNLAPSLAELLLKGNSHTKGKEIDLSNSAFIRSNYSSLSIGKSSYSPDQKLSKFSYGLSMLIGHSYRGITLNDGTLTTDSANSYIDSDLDVQMVNSRTADIGGLGLGLEIGASWQLNPGRWLNIDIRDLGFISWNQAEIFSSVTGPKRFEGFQITNVNSIGDFSNWSDTLESDYFEEKESSKLAISPFNVRAVLRSSLNNQNELVTQINYRYLPGFLPQLGVHYSKRLTNLSYDLGFRAGGFTYLASSLGATISLGNKTAARIRIQGVESLFSSSLPLSFGGGIDILFQ